MDPHSGQFKTMDNALAEMGLKAPGKPGTPAAARNLLSQKHAQKKLATLANADMVTAQEIVEAGVQIPADLWPKFEVGAQMVFQGCVFEMVSATLGTGNMELKFVGVTRNYLRKAAMTMRTRDKQEKRGG